MNILAIDSATEKFSVALCTGGHTLSFESDADLRHSELIMDSIDGLFKQAALRPEDLCGVVCMAGPGSFTGLRIGFSIAKGLALSLGIPFAAISTLDCMARPFRARPGIVVPAIDAKKKAFFCALYRKGEKLCPDMDAQPAEIAGAIAGKLAPESPPEQVLLAGPGAQMLYDALPDRSGIAMAEPHWGNAETLLEIALETQILNRSNIDYSCGPEYIRKSDAELTRESTNYTNERE